MTCYNSELPIGPPGPTGPQGPQGEPATLPYKVYTALLTQSGETAPVAIVLENTIGEITWEYLTTGHYTANSAGLFTVDKTWTVFASVFDNTVALSIPVTSGSNGNSLPNIINVRVDGGDDFGNNLLNKASIEIRVYN